MLFCRNCNKEVVIYGVSHMPGVEEKLEKLRESIEKEGKLIIFNPPPINPYRCPDCFGELEEK